MKIKKLIITLLVLIIGCQEENPDIEFGDRWEPFEAMEGNWRMDQVIRDQDDVTQDWENFEIQFTRTKNYQTIHSMNSKVWPDSGSFEYLASGGIPDRGIYQILIRNDDVTVRIQRLAIYHPTSSFELHLSLYTEDHGWIFKFMK